MAQTPHARLRKADMQRMLESISDALWSAVVEADGRVAYRYFSAGIESIAGRPPSHFLDAPRQWLEHLHAADQAAHDERLARIAAGACDREDAEYRIVHADGSLRWLRDAIRVAHSPDGGVVLHGVLSDITKRKAAERALRESEGRFRSLTELSSDWFWRQDERLRFTYLSPEVLDLAGDSAESSLGKSRWELQGVTLITGTWEQHRAALEAREPFRELEYFRVGHDGQRRYISVSGAPIFDEGGRFLGYQGIGRNITDRKRIEQDLRARQEMLDLAQKIARAVAFEVLLQTELPRRWPAELEALHGLEAGAFDGTSKAWKRVIVSDDWPQVERAMARALASGDLFCEYRVAHADARLRWLQVRGRLFFDVDGRPARVVGFALDVSERKKAEEDRRLLERQLRQSQRLEALGTLSGGIAHDFNNILGAILGYGEVAQRESPRGSKLRRDLDSIIAAGERGRALVERILAFSRSGAGGERRHVHVEAVVREAVELIGTQVPAGVALQTRLDAGQAAIAGDATEVHQVVMNLITNALHAMPDGGVLAIELDARAVEPGHVATTGKLAPGDYVVLSVRDTGAGIDKDVIDRIFDPFFTTKDVGVGTGLGLSLVHGIVADAGGAIDVHSRVGHGSSFTVYLPRSGDADGDTLEWSPDLPHGAGELVLVVDDEPALVTLTVENLQALGYRAQGFTSSLAALETFRLNPGGFDAVVTDERMPGLTGAALIRALRDLRPDLPIVLASGYAPGDVVHRAVEANDVLRKPLLRRELALCLERVLVSRRP